MKNEVIHQTSIILDINKCKFNEILYKYDSDYWKYVNHYDNVEEPNFEIIDKKETDTSCDFSCY